MDTAATAHNEDQPEIQTGLGKAIASLFCFFPTGILAIWFSAKAGDYVAAGKYDKARSMASASRFLVKLSVIMFPLWLIGVVLFKMFF